MKQKSNFFRIWGKNPNPSPLLTIYSESSEGAMKRMIRDGEQKDVYFIQNDIQIQTRQGKIMGCGALCGNEQKHQHNELNRKILLSLLPTLQQTPLMPTFSPLLKSIEVVPLQYCLPSTVVLPQKPYPSPAVLNKWKIIVLGERCSSTAYANCLGYSKCRKQITSTQPQNNRNQECSPLELFPMECWVQIEKDLGRTFPRLEADFSSQQLEHTLRRITNHFPKMGYTQGINFIIGYLLIVGFSTDDTFCLFVRLALSPRFLLLGLFEDHFPLCQVYLTMFRTILRQRHGQLYQHLYQHLCIDESLWVFKWFMSFYVYGWPIEMIQYVLDCVVLKGGVALVFFAVALAGTLQKGLLSCADEGEVSEFFADLKDKQHFHKLIKMDQVIDKVLRMELTDSEVAGFQDRNIYQQFFKTFFTEDGIQKLQPWYENLTAQREEFRKMKLKQKIQLIQENCEKHMRKNSSIQELAEEEQQQQFDPPSIFLIESAEIQDSFSSKTPTVRISLEQMDEDNPSQQSSRVMQRPRQYNNFVPGISLNANDHARKGNFKMNPLENIKNQKLSLNQRKSPDILDIFTQQLQLTKKHSIQDLERKKGRENYDGNRMTKVGQSILSSLSASNASNCSDKHEYNGRQCGRCFKKKIENQLPESSPRKMNIATPQKLNQHQSGRKNTLNNEIILNNSLSPNPNMTKCLELGSEVEVEILQGVMKQMFKKNKKGIGEVRNDKIMSNGESQSTSRVDMPKISIEESYESIFVGNLSSQKSSIVSCQIQSVR